MVAVRAALLVTFLASFAPRAEAQTSQEQARALFTRGLEHARDQSWVEALEAFRASAAIHDRASTRLNIASILLRLGRHLEARDELHALRDGGALATHEQSEVDALLERALDGLRSIAVRVHPPEASLTVDGRPVEARGAERRFEVDPGAHRLEARADGYVSEVQELAPHTTRATFRLAPLPAHLRVRSDLAAAEIRIDGDVAGRGTLDAELTPGRHELRVTAPRHHPFERWLSLAPGQRMEILASLSPIATAGEEVWESAWFWAVGAGVVVLATLGVVLGLTLTAEPAYDGGSLDDVLVPE